jgi:CheY-like chemotaxis protein
MEPFSTLSILLLEDEYLIALDAREMLHSLGVKQLQIVNTLAAATDAAKRADVDLAILDLNIHGDMSYGVADQFRENGTPIVFASGYELRDRLGSVLEHGDVYLRKPYTAETLKQAMGTALEAAKQRPPAGIIGNVGDVALSADAARD